MPTRPKQRVLVRWNDDLDKALLLFITHICAESGIKIPYDEVARRMGSTFTEGAITQHLSKLRTKMAELNVVPVPDAAKRGSVTNKPSSVYAQKGRAGPPPPQPVASKTQARNAASRNTANGTGRKRTTRRKTGFIKRSESDDGQTDDEFDGGSDDDFGIDRNARNKRKRGANDVRDQARRQTTTLEDQQARTNQFVNDSIETMAGRGFEFHHGQLSQPAEYEEEEEDEQTSRGHSQFNQQIARTPSSIAMRQDHAVSPATFGQMPTQIGHTAHYNGPQAFPSNSHSNFRQMYQGFAPSAFNVPGYQNQALNTAYHSVSSTAEGIDSEGLNNHRPVPQSSFLDMPANSTPSTVTTSSYNPQAHMILNSGVAFQNPGSNRSNHNSYLSHVNGVDSGSSHLRQAAVMPLPNYGGAQLSTRNGSMTSSNSQVTHSTPMTPVLRQPGGIDSIQQSPFNFNANDLSPARLALPSSDEPTVSDQMRNNQGGYDGQDDSFDSYLNGAGEEVITNGDQFLQDMFN